MFIIYQLQLINKMFKVSHKSSGRNSDANRKLLILTTLGKYWCQLLGRLSKVSPNIFQRILQHQKIDLSAIEKDHG